MEHNFHSIRERSSNLYSSPSNHSTHNNVSYFTNQAIRAGFSSPDPRRHQFHRNPNDIRESIQRELEKERIRAEIIAEEVYRRRILEDEVRREMMFEREMALRRGDREFVLGSPMRFEPRVPLLTDVEHPVRVAHHREVVLQGSQLLPFQRDPEVAGNGNVNGFSPRVTLKEIKELKGPAVEVNKDKVMILAKSNATDSKRKATTPPIGAPVDPSAGLKKPKTQEEWSCALCRVTATSEQGLSDHLRGKKHRAQESGLNAQRTGFGTGPLPKMRSTSTGKPIKVLGATKSSLEKEESSKAALPQKTPASAKSNKQCRFYCDLCQLGVRSLNVMNAHMKGKRHLAKVAKLNKIDEPISGEKPVEKAVVEDKKENKETNIAGSVNKKCSFFCDLCQLKVQSLKVMNAHTRGKRHLAKVAKLNKIDEPASGEKPVEKGMVEDKKENKETDMAESVEKSIVEDKKELDFTAVVVEKPIMEQWEDQIKSNKESVECDVSGIEEDEDKVFGIVDDFIVANKDGNSEQ